MWRWVKFSIQKGYQKSFKLEISQFEKIPLPFQSDNFFYFLSSLPQFKNHSHSYYEICMSLRYVKMESVSHSFVFDFLQPHGLQPIRFLCPYDSPGKNTGVGCHFLLQGIFSTQGLNSGLLHCRQILYHLSYQGSPYVLRWRKTNEEPLI